MDGILNLDKPKGWTSHDMVARVRRLTGVRRVGHAGTLDPMATGVLLICLGRATRITEYLMAGRKRYRAVVRLGISTDSHDADGQVTATAPVTADRAKVEAALDRFRGAIEQIPPMVSAIKRDGQPLYKLARRGIAVERPPRPVHVYELTLTDWSPPTSPRHRAADHLRRTPVQVAGQVGTQTTPDLTLELACSPGTYVRALARDLGEVLGCGAHLTSLVRTASGDFTLDQALEMERFVQAVEEGVWHALVLPMDAGLKNFPTCTLDAIEGRRVRGGQSLPATAIAAPHDQLCRAYAAETGTRLLALLKFDPDAQLWRPYKVFHPL